MRYFYHFSVSFYHALIYLAAGCGQPKAKKMVLGRRDLWKSLEEKILPDQSYIWMHCASLGEFEQGRPVLEGIKKQWPKKKIVLTFFSSSGYEIRKNYNGVDIVSYLPFDSPKNAARWLKLMRPEMALFVKYELWYFHLQALQQKKVPIWLISARFRPEQIFFKSYGVWFKKMLSFFQRIYVQDAASVLLLQKLGIDSLLAGDTRVDRVLALQQTTSPNERVAAFAQNRKMVVLGSVWPADGAIVLQALQLFPEFKAQYIFLFAPHEIKENEIAELCSALKQVFGAEKVGRYSDVQLQPTDLQVLVIDNVGLLSGLYQYGHLAYIGGGFGKGIHNTLEPAAWGLPLAFGPKYTSFSEAVAFVESASAQVLTTASDFAAWIHTFEQAENYKTAELGLAEFLITQKGATATILSDLAFTLQKS